MLALQMRKRFQMLKPRPLTFILILLVLLTQGLFLSSTTTTFSMSGETESPTIHTFGLGTPIQVSTWGNRTSYHIRWGVLALNLGVSYLFGMFVSIGMGKSGAKPMKWKWQLIERHT